ncbi:MAG: lysine 2,3-aminomutase [Blastocatellia bacterium]
MTSAVDLRNQSGFSEEPRDPSQRYYVYTQCDLAHIPQLACLPEHYRFSMRTVANVLPFRVNRYVVENLIDWDRVPDDPIFQLTFPQPGMLAPDQFDQMANLFKSNGTRDEIKALATKLRLELNPHPAGQLQLNVPSLDGHRLEGIQHKYPETVLFFPSQGQTCHAYCTFCFRWAQFVGDRNLIFAAKEQDSLHRYLSAHKEVTDLLITGGDPMIMKTRYLARYLEPFLDRTFDHVRNIRIGTKALAFWPYRFTSDDDADDLLRLIERLISGGKNICIIAHYNHWRELETAAAAEAIRRVQSAGPIIRSQGPLLAHINDDADVWARLWSKQVSLNIVPYYMFVERDTGARRYFEVPLARACEIYRNATKQVSGLARHARGPSMSAGPGKVEIQGVAEVAGEKVFVLRFIQARNPDWVQRPFFARFDCKATWLDELKPAFQQEKFFFENEYEAMCAPMSLARPGRLKIAASDEREKGNSVGAALEQW